MMEGRPGEVQLITDALMETVLGQARRSPRQRMNLNFHAGPDDNPHRFLNVLVEGTYVTPHRHSRPPKAESFVVLQGKLGVVLFGDDGNPRERYVVGSGEHAVPKAFTNCAVGQGIDLPAGVWHTIVALTPHAVIFEVKPGPWDPAADKEFAPWAPPEGDPKAVAYLATLLSES